jgi:hypothetical protein
MLFPHSVALAHTSTAPPHSLSLTFFFLSAAFRSVGSVCSAFFLCATEDPVLLTEDPLETGVLSSLIKGGLIAGYKTYK